MKLASPLLGLLGAAGLALVASHVVPDPKWRNVPGERDPQVVGRWWSEYDLQGGGEGGRIEYTFRADGTGDFAFPRRSPTPLTWGTKDGVLYTRFLAVDFWPLSAYPYRSSSRTLTLRSRKGWDRYWSFRETLHRR